jgi:hypothetical protein
MDLNSLNNSKYLGKQDVPLPGLRLTIGSFGVEQFDEGPKLVIYWQQAGIKPMLCNKANRNRLIDAFGTSNTDAMIGLAVIVYNDPNVEFGGKRVGGLRFRIPQQQLADPPQAEPEPPAAPARPGPDPALRAQLGRQAPPQRPAPPPIPEEWVDDVPY